MVCIEVDGKVEMLETKMVHIMVDQMAEMTAVEWVGQKVAYWAELWVLLRVVELVLL